MTVPARTSLVTLGVADVERAAAFYERLGWTRSPASVPGTVAFFGTNGAVVGLWSAAELAADANLPAGPPPAFRGVAVAVNVESEPAVDAALAAAVEAGATLLKPGTRAEWGGYSSPTPTATPGRSRSTRAGRSTTPACRGCPDGRAGRLTPAPDSGHGRAA